MDSSKGEENIIGGAFMSIERTPEFVFLGNILQIKVKGEFVKVEIEKIKFIKPIGSGANGFVFKAIQEPFDRVVAVKFWTPNKNRGFGEVVQKQYLEEIKKVAKLKDENIISVYDASSTILQKHGIYYSVMEYVEGITLKKWKEKSSHNLEERASLAKQILTTVSNYHKESIYHGDLHHDNIMITNENKIKILDFGTSIFTKVSERNKSKERESLLICETIFNLVRDYRLEFLCEFKPNKWNSKYVNNDVRYYDPEDVCETLLNLIDILELLDYSISDVYVSYDLAAGLSKAPLIDIGNSLNYIIKRAEKENIEKQYIIGFLSAFISSIKRLVLPQETEETVIITCAAYYNILKKTRKENISDSWEELNIEDVEKKEDLIRIANYFVFESTLEFMAAVAEVYKLTYNANFVSLIGFIRVKLFGEIVKMFTFEGNHNTFKLYNTLLREINKIKRDKVTYEMFLKDYEDKRWNSLEYPTRRDLSLSKEEKEIVNGYYKHGYE